MMPHNPPTAPPSLSDAVIAECLTLLRDVVQSLVQQNKQLMEWAATTQLAAPRDPYPLYEGVTDPRIPHEAADPLINLNDFLDDVPAPRLPETLVTALGGPPVMPPIGGLPADPTPNTNTNTDTVGPK